MNREPEELAKLVIDAERLGVIDAWRPYIRDQQVSSGISNEALKGAIERMKNGK